MMGWSDDSNSDQEFQPQRELAPSSSFSKSDSDEELQNQTQIQYYGHKRVTEHLDSRKEKSEEIEENLLRLSQSNPAVYDALKAIFDHVDWKSKMRPVDPTLLRNDALRVATRGDDNKTWYPCQLGCPNGIRPGKKPITQPHKATEHVDWHLGIQRHECSVCHETFSRKQACDNHEKLHNHPEGTPCPKECGVTFVLPKKGNINRHLAHSCPNNQ